MICQTLYGSIGSRPHDDSLVHTPFTPYHYRFTCRSHRDTSVQVQTFGRTLLLSTSTALQSQQPISSLHYICSQRQQHHHAIRTRLSSSTFFFLQGQAISQASFYLNTLEKTSTELEPFPLFSTNIIRCPNIPNQLNPRLTATSPDTVARPSTEARSYILNASRQVSVPPALSQLLVQAHAAWFPGPRLSLVRPSSRTLPRRWEPQYDLSESFCSS